MSLFNSLGTVARKGFTNLLAAREREARLSVHAFLANLDDETLARAGFRREDLKRGGNPNPFL